MNEIPDERRGMTLCGNAGANSLVGTNFAEVLDAGADNDVLIGNNGNVLLSNTSLTGSGAQSHTNMERFVITGSSVDDRLDASACTRGAVTLLGLADNDTLVGSSSGGDNNDRIDGPGGHDTLLGGTGNDSMTGGAGNDVMLGGNGDDTLNGEEGRDTLAGQAGNDVIIGATAGEIDEVFVTDPRWFTV